MSKERKLYGAAAFTHALKEYGYGKSMHAGLKRYGMESMLKCIPLCIGLLRKQAWGGKIDYK